MSLQRRTDEKNGEISGDANDEEDVSAENRMETAGRVSDHSCTLHVQPADVPKVSTSFLASLIIFRIAGKQKQTVARYV